MQKKLIALAIAGLATAPAFAQSNVTIYGVADVSQELVDAKGAVAGDTANIQRRGRLSSNSSLLGFKGAEDLGNGLKAIFQFETTVSGDTGGFGGGRDTFVGLTSSWGTIVGGNLTHPIRAMGTKVSMSPGATGIGFTGATYGTILGVKTGTDDRASNAVAYVSPSIAGGLTFTGAYVNGENARDSNTAIATNPAPGKEINAWQGQLAAQYENGPLYVGLGYHHAKDPQAFGALNTASGINATAAEIGAYSDKVRVVRLAATYMFPSATKLSAMWDRQKYYYNSASTDVNAIGSGDIRRDAWLLGVSQDFGPNTIYGEYSQANKAKVNGADLNDTKIKQWTLGYNYNFSKRTMLKAYYTEIRNGDSTAADFYINPVGNSTQSLATGADPRGIGVGLRHVF